VYLAGEIDISASDHLYEVLRDAVEQTLGTVEVNLHRVRLLDCSGIRALLRARADAHESGRAMFISGPSGIVLRVLDLTDALTVLTADVPLHSSPPSATDRRPLGAAVAMQNRAEASRRPTRAARLGRHLARLVLARSTQT
jgi:anti-anti-sigma factor